MAKSGPLRGRASRINAATSKARRRTEVTTLYKRATPSQVRVLRIIEGAVRNASHAHPDKRVSDEMVRSIAKRAAGTLTAGWPDVLAARTLFRRSLRTSGEISYRRPQGAQTSKRFGRGSPTLLGRRSPLQKVWKALYYEIGMAKRAGNSERMCALVYVIRIIAAIQKIDEQQSASERVEGGKIAE